MKKVSFAGLFYAANLTTGLPMKNDYKNLVLFRQSFTEDSKAVHGAIYCPGDTTFMCYTLEPLYLANAADLSSIPAGNYKCKIRYCSKRLRHFAVLDVPGRTGILIHAGNSVNDTTGCILVGSRRTANGLADSQKALKELVFKLPNVFTLTIVEI